jgi:hypothetical protein
MAHRFRPVHAFSAMLAAKAHPVVAAGQSEFIENLAVYSSMVGQDSEGPEDHTFRNVWQIAEGFTVRTVTTLPTPEDYRGHMNQQIMVDYINPGTESAAVPVLSAQLIEDWREVAQKRRRQFDHSNPSYIVAVSVTEDMQLLRRFETLVARAFPDVVEAAKSQLKKLGAPAQPA